MNLANLDLNLLVSLDALLRERSVTRAAARMNLSQPALSAALAKLRRHFGDELLVRSGNSHQLTPLALQLRDRVTVALADVERVFATAPRFDPAECEREFHVLASDYGLTVLAARLAAEITARAPKVRLRFEQHTPAVVDEVADRLRTIDLIWIPHGFISDFPHLNLYSDSWVCVADAANPAIEGALTLDNLRTLPWVANYQTPTAYTPATRQMQLLGIDPHVQVVTDSFTALPAMVAGTDRIAMLQSRLADRIPARMQLKAWPLPFDAVPLVEAAWWHPLSDRDIEHRFLREILADVAASTPPPGHSLSE